MGILPAGIAHFPGRRVRLLDARDDLPADGTVFIRRIDQVEEVRRDAQGQLVIGQFGPGEFLRGEVGHEPLKLLR